MWLWLYLRLSEFQKVFLPHLVECLICCWDENFDLVKFFWTCWTLLSVWFAVGTKILTWWKFFGLCEFLWNSWDSQKSVVEKIFPPSSCWTLLSVWFAVGTKILTWWKFFGLCEFLWISWNSQSSVS